MSAPLEGRRWPAERRDEPGARLVMAAPGEAARGVDEREVEA